jgi:thioester reductase-like protein
MSGALEKVPEAPLEDWRLAKMGYEHSKLVAERLLSKQPGLRDELHVLRVGQVAGPVGKGEMESWNQWEWLPSLVRSSLFLGKMPRTLGPMNGIDWVSVDLVERVIGELVMVNSKEGIRTKGEQEDGKKKQVRALKERRVLKRKNWFDVESVGPKCQLFGRKEIGC